MDSPEDHPAILRDGSLGFFLFLCSNKQSLHQGPHVPFGP